MMNYIEIQGYKSLKAVRLELKPVNILIGANGAGKSNFISFFTFLESLYHQRLKEYVATNGGVQKFLFLGSKVTEKIAAKISFDAGANEYSFSISPGENEFIFSTEQLWHEGSPLDIANFIAEASVRLNNMANAKTIRRYLESFKKYHFHDTGKLSPFSNSSHIINDAYYLYERGENLAAFLYNIKETQPIAYRRIVKIIQDIAPYFSDFYFHPVNDTVRLQWTDKFSSFVYGPSDLSDGTIRFIALATLFLQPTLPSILVIDEPELGLHPFAIVKLAGLIQSAANKGTQVIIATQSTDLISRFEPEDIVTVDQVNGATELNRLEKETLAEWLDGYTVGELWKRNIINKGQP